MLVLSVARQAYSIKEPKLTQTKQRNDFTGRLIEKHIQEGMNVLDIGCGNGDCSFLLGEAVGKNGKVEGVDINRASLAAAQERKKMSDAQNISFSCADINALSGRKYDAVFGRRILMYLPDPLLTVENLKKLLEPDGIMLFQESDEAGSLLNGDRFPVHSLAQEWIWETVRREGGDTHIGGSLYKIMKEAKMSVADYCSEAVLQTSETGSDIFWVVSVMKKRMEAAGINARLDSLEERLGEEMRSSSFAFVRDLAFGICAKKQD